MLTLGVDLASCRIDGGQLLLGRPKLAIGVRYNNLFQKSVLRISIVFTSPFMNSLVAKESLTVILSGSRRIGYKLIEPLL